MSTVCWLEETVAVGLNPTRKRMSSPFEMPPWTPPEWLVVVVGGRRALDEGVVVLEAGHRRGRETAADLEPLAAGSDSMACASSASSLSKTGSPRPGWHSSGNAFDDAAKAVAALASRLDGWLMLGRPRRRATRWVGFDLSQRHRCRVDVGRRPRGLG